LLVLTNSAAAQRFERRVTPGRLLSLLRGGPVRDTAAARFLHRSVLRRGLLLDGLPELSSGRHPPAHRLLTQSGCSAIRCVCQYFDTDRKCMILLNKKSGTPIA
jgi:hypothetical protein